MDQRKLYAERPGWGPDFDYDESRHAIAYRYASELGLGLRVLDAGCGEGFQTQTLGDGAASVLGVDYHAEAVETARRNCRLPNVRFAVVDLSKDSSLDERFDLVLNFQVIEHIADDRSMVARLRSLIAPGGTLMMTTPNLLQSFSENPCHLREYTPETFASLLRTSFDQVEILGVFGNERVLEFDRNRRRAIERILKLDPLGIRHLLPERLLHTAFARLGQLVRRVAHRSIGETPVTASDFRIEQGDVARALDLVAICRV